MFNISELFANRIGGKAYLNNSNINRFTKMNRIKQELINKGYDILDFGNRELDGLVINSLIKKVEMEKNNDIIDNNCIDFKKSYSGYLKVEYNIDIDYKTELMHSIGIKEVLNLLPLAFINENDYIITTSFGCDVMVNMGKWLNCKIYEYKLNKFNRYLIDFDDIDENILKKCKILYLNYPNNPTGAVADKHFFEEVIKYAKKYNFIVVHDASYIDLCFDKKDKISFLSVDGAKDVGVEIFKIYDDCNTVIVAGNKNIIKAYSFIKENVNISKLLETRETSARVLKYCENISKEAQEIYLRRHNLIKDILVKYGFRVDVPKAGLYQYVSIPKSCNGVSFESASEFALWLMENAHIMVIPYDNEGKYIGLSMDYITNNEEEKKIATELDSRLSKYKFNF